MGRLMEEYNRLMREKDLALAQVLSSGKLSGDELRAAFEVADRTTHGEVGPSGQVGAPAELRRPAHGGHPSPPDSYPALPEGDSYPCLTVGRIEQLTPGPALDSALEAFSKYKEAAQQPTVVHAVAPPLRIVAAAVRTDLGLVCHMPAPARHADVRRALEGYLNLWQTNLAEGFLDSSGRFRTRIAAAAIAYDAGQTATHEITLNTEHLW